MIKAAATIERGTITDAQLPKNAVGRIAVGVTVTIAAQHRVGMARSSTGIGPRCSARL
ncbi:hypothetical protein [Nocardia amamiensis]|uniref:hypothetical protein n=1 Tax=Nocardia TaxID=1817 RepID=UPI0033D5476E